MVLFNQRLVLLVNGNGVRGDVFQIGQLKAQVLFVAFRCVQLAAQRLRLLAKFAHHFFELIIATF